MRARCSWARAKTFWTSVWKAVFSDARYMIRMFAEEFGCSPREYRRKNASGEAAEGGARDTAQTILGAGGAIRVLQTAREEFGLCEREL